MLINTLSTISARVQEDAEKICPFCGKGILHQSKEGMNFTLCFYEYPVNLKKLLPTNVFIAEIDQKGVFCGFFLEYFW